MKYYYDGKYAAKVNVNLLNDATDLPIFLTEENEEFLDALRVTTYAR